MHEGIKRRIQLLLLTSILSALALLAGVSSASSSSLIFDRDSVDLGQMEEGRKLKFQVDLTNISGKHLKVISVETSCGCTEAEAINTSIAPGETGVIQIDMDTTGKSGRFLKVLEITTDNEDEPYELTLTGDVIHGETGSEPGAIFRDKCASCHMGHDLEDKSAQELYDSLCYICHKEDMPGTGERTEVAYLMETISHGLTGTSMPAFSQEHKGPLGSRQIEALISLIANSSERQP